MTPAATIFTPALAALFVLSPLCLASAQGPLQDDLRAQLTARLDAIVRSVDGVVGYVVVDLTSGEQVAARLEREPFPTASAIKVPILYELLKRADEGTLELDVATPLDRSQVAGGSGVLRHLTTPALSLRDHAALMMILSDNTATNVVIDAVGMASVTARMQELGLGDIRLRRKMMDDAAVRRGDENLASPASLLKSTELLWKGEGLTPARRDLGREIMLLVSGAIRSIIPSRIAVFSKTGSLTGVRAETAIVDLPNAPFGIAVMTTYLKEDAAGSRAIGEIAAAAYSYFDRVATSGRYGRRSP
ncbi:MAG TPA: serine hydrolase [Vicinamibacterales bacterium]|nr:serine hydrolase [Vicinamibacterales bacterium]